MKHVLFMDSDSLLLWLGFGFDLKANDSDSDSPQAGMFPTMAETKHLDA